jgi:hypothetical protein
MHGALKLTVPFEVTRGLIFASLLGWRNVLQILTWRCRGIRPDGIVPSTPNLLLKERMVREETRYQFV